MFGGPQPVGEVGVEAEARLDVVVVVGRDRQRLEAVGGAAPPRWRRCRAVAKARCWTAEPNASAMKWPAKVRVFSAPFSVRRSVPSAFSIAWLRTMPEGSMMSTVGAFRGAEDRGVEQQPGQHLVVGHGLGDVVDRDEAGVGDRHVVLGGDELGLPDPGERRALVDEVHHRRRRRRGSPGSRARPGRRGCSKSWAPRAAARSTVAAASSTRRPMSQTPMPCVR